MEFDAILEILEENNRAVAAGAEPFTVEQLTEFTRQLSVALPEHVNFTMLYSGGLEPDGQGGFLPPNKAPYTFRIAQLIADTRPEVGIVDNTPAMRLIFTTEFGVAIENTAIHNQSRGDDLLYGSRTNTIRNPDGIVDDISRRFVIENADRSITLLTPFSKHDSTFLSAS